MKLKRSYSAREVAALTGLSARQLQWWDARSLFSASVASRPTKAGGFTERRYSPVDSLRVTGACGFEGATGSRSRRSGRFSRCSVNGSAYGYLTRLARAVRSRS